MRPYRDQRWVDMDAIVSEAFYRPSVFRRGEGDGDATVARRAPTASAAQDMGAATVDEGEKLLVEPTAEADIESKERTKTASGLEYIDVVTGQGPNPSVGIQARGRWQRTHCDHSCLMMGVARTSQCMLWLFTRICWASMHRCPATLRCCRM